MPGDSVVRSTAAEPEEKLSVRTNEMNATVRDHFACSGSVIVAAAACESTDLAEESTASLKEARSGYGALRTPPAGCELRVGTCRFGERRAPVDERVRCNCSCAGSESICVTEGSSAHIDTAFDSLRVTCSCHKEDRRERSSKACND